MNNRKEVASMPAGSTVFLALILLLVSSLIFTLLEGVRIVGLKSNAKIDSQLVTESLLAEYCMPAIEKYHLFMLDGSFGTGKLNISYMREKVMNLLEENLAEKHDFQVLNYDMYHMQAVSCEVKNYRMITDDDGEAFYQLVTDYMKSNLSKEVAEMLYQKTKQASEAKKLAGDLDKKREAGLENLEQAKEEKTSEAIEKSTMNDTDSKVENPITYIADWKNTGIIQLIGADENAMSRLAIDRSQSLEKRVRISGTDNFSMKNTGWYEKILFQEYLMKYFACYTGQKADTALQYELEYIISGKSTDKENLADVATRLLAVREAANFVFIQADREKCAEALTLATLLAGCSGNALLISVVQEGILAVWAFAESVSDVKSLLKGKKIPIIKSSFQWSTDVKRLNKEQSFQQSKDCENGLDYEDYLRILLYFGDRNAQCLRALDIIEQNIHLIEGYESIRMDMMMDKLSISCTYKAKPLFLSLVTIGNVAKSPYQWNIITQDTYLQDE